ncbi:MAG: hypothetical protein IKJ30_06105 [Bacilli bacterium]|jgi:hypothetical protein|nr:hypothetical protein [Bacilli bacterium]MBR6640754.1 hypothetical protein [Clostridia bacterium]
MSGQEDIKKYNQMVEKRRILLERFETLQEMENKLNSDNSLSEEARIKNKQKLLEEYTKVANLLKELTAEAEALADKLEAEE